MKIRVYTWREMQTDLANEGMPIEADARAVRPYRSSESPAWYYSLLTTTYYLLLTLSSPFQQSSRKKRHRKIKKRPTCNTFLHFLGFVMKKSIDLQHQHTIVTHKVTQLVLPRCLCHALRYYSY